MGAVRPGADCNTAARTTLARLTWWAHALREARHEHPYIV